MGKVASKLIKRPIKNFNIENRAHRIIDKDIKPKPAPLHESSKTHINEFIKENKDLLDKEIYTKNPGLDERLKGMVVQTTSPGEIKSKRRALPEDRSKVEETEYGYTEPLKIKQGHLSIKQTMEMLGRHSLDPANFPVEMMAKEYNISEEDARVIVQYFKVFRLQLPKKDGVDESSQESLQPPLLPSHKEVTVPDKVEGKK